MRATELERTPGGPPEARVLIIEDDAAARRALCAAVAAGGYQPIAAAGAVEGLREFWSQAPHVVLLDLGLADLQGIEVARRIRSASQAPLIVVSARRDEDEQIAALDCGADDYVTKPFRVGELLARIRAVLRQKARRQGDAQEDVLAINGLRIDRARRIVSVDQVAVVLTPTEYRLLGFMAERAGVVVSHRQLLTAVWGADHATEVEYLRVYMRRLRVKLEGGAGKPRFFVTVPRVGYLFIAHREPAGAAMCKLG